MKSYFGLVYMKKVFFTLIFVIGFVNNAFANNLSRYIEDCLAVIDKPEIKTTSSYGNLKYNFSKDEEFLRSETAKKYAEQGQEFPVEYKPIGLTKVRQGFDFDMEVGVISISDGKYCVYPKKIEAYIGYYVPTIYILKGLQKETCVYDVALRHEKTHMEIYILALDYFMPIFKKSVEGLLNKVGVKIADNVNDTENVAKALNEAYVNQIKYEVDAWRKTVEDEQMKLDSMNNYILENRICNEIDKK